MKAPSVNQGRNERKTDSNGFSEIFQVEKDPFVSPLVVRAVNGLYCLPLHKNAPRSGRNSLDQRLTGWSRLNDWAENDVA